MASGAEQMRRIAESGAKTCRVESGAQRLGEDG